MWLGLWTVWSPVPSSNNNNHLFVNPEKEHCWQAVFTGCICICCNNQHYHCSNEIKTYFLAHSTPSRQLVESHFNEFPFYWTSSFAFVVTKAFPYFFFLCCVHSNFQNGTGVVFLKSKPFKQYIWICLGSFCCIDFYAWICCGLSNPPHCPYHSLLTDSLLIFNWSTLTTS